MKDFRRLFRKVILILRAFGRFKQGSYMIRFSLKKSVSCNMGNELEGDKSECREITYYNGPYGRRWQLGSVYCETV